MIWLPLDLLLVGVFAAIGRMSHDESLTPVGWWHTAWPFLAGALAGWAIVLVVQRSGGSLTAGVVVWLASVGLGMLLRQLTGQGTALAFVIVATVVLGALLLVPRLVAAR